MKLAGTGYPVGNVVLMLLPWVGKYYFDYEALRRAMKHQENPEHQATTALTPLMVLPNNTEGHNLADWPINPVTLDTDLNNFEQTVGFKFLEEQIKIIMELSSPCLPVCSISAMAGCGKTAVGQFVLQSFITQENRRRETLSVETLTGFALGAAHTDPTDQTKKIAMWLVPGRELRDDVTDAMERTLKLQNNEVLRLGRPADSCPNGEDANALLRRRTMESEELRPIMETLAALGSQLAGLFQGGMAESDAGLMVARITVLLHMKLEVVWVYCKINSISKRLLSNTLVVVATHDLASKVVAGRLGGPLGNVTLHWPLPMRLRSWSL